MEKSDVYNMRAVPLMRKINIVKDGKTKSIVEENISMNEIRNMSCEPRMLIRKMMMYILQNFQLIIMVQK